jgi:probable phosphoglycerate mutase
VTGAPARQPGAQAGGEATVLVLLRHGESALTAQKRFSGSGADVDPELSGRGRWQAGRAARELAARGDVQAVVSSPLARCRQTAEAAAAALGLDLTVEPGLRETDFGVWEGLTFAEVRARHPAELTAWFGSATVAPPGGESFAEVERRVTACRDALLAAMPGRTLLLVSHVTPVKTLARLALGAPVESLFRMDLAPASLTEVAHYPDGNASLRFLNATSHLR